MSPVRLKVYGTIDQSSIADEPSVYTAAATSAPATGRGQDRWWAATARTPSPPVPEPSDTSARPTSSVPSPIDRGRRSGRPHRPRRRRRRARLPSPPAPTPAAPRAAAARARRARRPGPARRARDTSARGVRSTARRPGAGRRRPAAPRAAAPPTAPPLPARPRPIPRIRNHHLGARTFTSTRRRGAELLKSQPSPRCPRGAGSHRRGCKHTPGEPDASPSPRIAHGMRDHIAEDVSTLQASLMLPPASPMGCGITSPRM